MKRKNDIWRCAAVIVFWFFILGAVVAIFSPANAQAPILENTVSVFICAPDTVDVDLLIERGFTIENNVAIGYYPVYNVWDSIVGMGRGMIYLELPDRRYDVNRDSVVNLFDCTRLIGILYKGFPR